MSKAIAILGIVSGILAVLSAAFLSGMTNFVPALFVLGTGIFLCISKDWKQIVPGASAIVFAILGILGLLQNIATEDGNLSLGIPEALGHAFIVVGMLEIVGVSLLKNWETLEPAWLNYAFAGCWLIAFVFAFVFSGDLGSVHAASLGVVIPGLGFTASSVMYLRET